MSRKTKAELAWTLTVLRSGIQGPVEELEEAEFRFGRRDVELEEAPIRRLSDGMCSLIRSCEIEDDATETGFTIQMRRTPGNGDDWRIFTMLVGNESWGPNWENPRSVYACEDLDGVIEFCDTGSPCSYYNQLPPRIWIRLIPLTMPIIAWAISNKIYSLPQGRSEDLHDWLDMSTISPREMPKLLILPGPPINDYTFFN